MNRETIEPNVTSVPGETAAAWIEFQDTYQATSTSGFESVWDVSGPAIGPFFTDTDGNVFMDFSSQVAAAPLGYNSPEFGERLEALDLGVDPLKAAAAAYRVGESVAPEDTEGRFPAHLMERLIERSAAYDMDKVFLTNSGAEAVENAMKIAYDNGGHRGVTFDGAFHGRTLGALSLNRSKQVHRRGFPEVPGVISVPYCTCSGECTCGWRTDGPGGNVLADTLDPDHGSVPPEEVAYIIAEPIQGEGGYHVPSEEFLADIAAIRDEYDIPVIADEIQSGLGRTGEFWAIDHTDLEPDAITAAKGLRVGATISREDLFPDEESRIASTWGGGDLFHSAVGAITIDVIEEQNLLKNATERGRQFREAIRDEDVFPPATDVRGRGLMIGVEFESASLRDDILDEAFERGLILLGCGTKTIRVLPPLNVTEREIGLSVERFVAAIEDVT